MHKCSLARSAVVWLDRSSVTQYALQICYRYAFIFTYCIKNRKIKLDEKFFRKIFFVKKPFFVVKKKFISFDSKLSEACFKSKKLIWSFFGKGGAVEDVFTCVNIRLPRELLFGRENPAAHMTGKVCHMGWWHRAGEARDAKCGGRAAPNANSR